jgi:integrase
VPYLYSDEDIEKIFAVADSFRVSRARKNKFAEKEIPLILRLLYCCGLRVGETVCIKVGDLAFERNLIILKVTKKYKQRMVPFGKDLAEVIYRYCIGMGILNDSDAYLFPADDTKSHISPGNVGNYYRIIRKKAGITCNDQTEHGRGACLHCFRHSFAVRSFDKNERSGTKASESVPFLSTYLGHDSLYETEKYLKYSGNYFEDTLTKFDDYSGELFPEVIIYE